MFSESSEAIEEARKKTEEKAKVVAAVWGTEVIQFLAVLGVLQYRTMLKKRMNHPCAIQPIPEIVLLQNR